MRLTRVLLAGLLGAVCLALLAAWQVPGRLDWNRYRGTIEALASASLGRSVGIAGPITLSLLPEPEIRAASVVIGGEDASGGPRMEVHSLHLRVALLPLLRGRVDARELALRGPDLAIGWPLGAGEFTGWPPSWLAAFSARVEEGRLRFGALELTGVEARVTVTDSGALTASGSARLAGQPVRFTARLTTQGADGVAGLDATIEAQGRFAGTTAGFAGQLGGDGAVTGQVVMRGRDLAQLTAAPPLPFSGEATLRAEAGRMVFSDLRLNVGGTALRGVAELGLSRPASLHLRLTSPRLDLDPWRDVASSLGAPGMTVTLDLDAEAAVLAGGVLRGIHAGLDLEDGRITLRGVAAILPGEAELRLAGVVARTDPARPRFEGTARLAAPALRDTLGWLDGAGLRLFPPMPPGVLARAVLDAHAVAEPGLLAMDRITGTLDGARVSGEVRLWPNARPVAPAKDAAKPDAGKAEAGKPEAGRPEPGKPEPGKPEAGRPGGDAPRPAILAALEFDTLALDPWLAGFRSAGPPKEGVGAGWTQFADVVRGFGGFDTDLRLHVGAATLAGETVSDLLLDMATQFTGRFPAAPARQGAGQAANPATPGAGPASPGPATLGAGPTGGPIAGPAASPGAAPSAASGPPAGAGDGRITLRKLDAMWRGVHVRVSGALGEAGRLSEGRLEAATADASALAGMLPAEWRLAPGFWRVPAVLSVQVAGPAEALGARVALDMADLRLEAQPVIDARAGKWAGSFSMRHPGAPRLLAMAGLADADRWLGEGSLSVIAQLSGARDRLSADSLDLTAGLLRVSAPLALDFGGDTPRLTGRVAADVLALPGPGGDERNPMPLAWLRGWQGEFPVSARQVLVGLHPVLRQANGVVHVKDGVLTLAPFTAGLGGGMLSASLAVDAAAEPPGVKLDANLTGARIGGTLAPFGGAPMFDLLSGLVDAKLSLTAAGHGPAALRSTLAGDVAVNVAQGVLRGFDLFRVKLITDRAGADNRAATDAALHAAINGGATAFDRLSLNATVREGGVELHDSLLTGPAGRAVFTGAVALPSATLDLRIALFPAVAESPEIAFRVVNSLARPHRSAEFSGFTRWLGERLQ